MTVLQINRAVKASIEVHGLYVTANKIGITHSTLTRYLGGMHCQAHVVEKIGAFAAKPLGKAAAKPVKAKKVKAAKKAKPAKKAKAKKVAKKSKSAKKAPKAKKPAKAKKAFKKSARTRKPKAPAAPTSSPAVDADQPVAAE